VTDNPVSDLTFILDDRILAGNSVDGRIPIWDVNERALLASFNQSGTVKRSANGVMQIYLPQERRLINLDFNTDAWHASLKQWQKDLCEKAGRALTPDEWQQYFAAEGPYPGSPSCPMPR
jgi:WD40 repeat protein